MDDRWREIVLEFEQMGALYAPEQLSDPDWCSKELARKGYSISFVYVTKEYAKHMLGKTSSLPDQTPSEVWVYQLWGPRYQSRGAPFITGCKHTRRIGGTCPVQCLSPRKTAD